MLFRARPGKVQARSASSFTVSGLLSLIAGVIGLAASTKAQMQTGTDNTTAVTPARMNDHDGVIKVAGSINSNVLSAGSVGVGSITHTGTGTYTITLSIAFTTAVYPVVVATTQANRVARVSAKGTGSFNVSTFADFTNSTPSDADFDFMAIGRQ